MQASWSELAVGYLVVGVFVVGLPLVFFVVTFLPGLMRTSGELIGEEQERRYPERRLLRPAQARPMGVPPRQRGVKGWPGRTFANTP